MVAFCNSGLLDGLQSRDTLKYNETLSELSTPHVLLNQNFSPKTNEAVTAGCVGQYIQAKSNGEIDVGAESNNRRELSIRTDASLVVNDQQNLSVNPSPLVNGSSICVVDGKLASGLIFSKSNCLQLREGTNNDVQLNLETEGALEVVGQNKIKEKLTASRGVKRVENDLQLDLQGKANSGLTVTDNVIDLSKSDLVDEDTITVSNGKIRATEYLFGEGFDADIDLTNAKTTVTLDLQGSEHIQIDKNKISTDLKPYTAGRNITISNNQISAQDPPEQKTYSAGAGLSLIGDTFQNALSIKASLGITVLGTAQTGYIISSQALKSKKRIMKRKTRMIMVKTDTETKLTTRKRFLLQGMSQLSIPSHLFL